MKRNNCKNKIEEKIAKSQFGEVFVVSDFSDMGSQDSVNRVLLRLIDKKIINKVMRGVYYKPEYNDFLGENVAPSPNKVAEAIARNFGWTIVPCGDTALNILGLSTQVLAVWSYVSDGTYKEYSFDNVKICFKRTTNKDISKFSYKTALVIQSLKALGKDNITDNPIKKISGILSTDEKEIMIKEAKISTSWVYEYLKIICKNT